MNKHDILELENGTLYLKIQEDFNNVSLEVASTVAKITRDGVLIANPDGTSFLSLTSDAIELLAEGMDMIKKYWEIDSLPHRHILFSCGCSMKWDDYWEEEENYEKPKEGNAVYCSDHDEEPDVFILRFNKIDFQ